MPTWAPINNKKCSFSCEGCFFSHFDEFGQDRSQDATKMCQSHLKEPLRRPTWVPRALTWANLDAKTTNLRLTRNHFSIILEVQERLRNKVEIKSLLGPPQRAKNHQKPQQNHHFYKTDWQRNGKRVIKWKFTNAWNQMTNTTYAWSRIDKKTRKNKQKDTHRD